MYRKFQNKYRIASIRLQEWDYGANASYFVTISTKNMKRFFGNVILGEMHLSAIGEIARRYWYELPRQFPIVELESFIVMPNHIHAILRIDAIHRVSPQTIHRVSPQTIHRVSPSPVSPHPGGITGRKNPMLYQNLSRMIRWYKGRVTYEIHKIEPVFSWLPRFYEKIIKDKRAYLTITRYIESNPHRWQEKFLS